MRSIWIILVLLSQIAIGKNYHVEFKSLSIKDGLSQGTVYSIYQDSTGFLWFGTQDGGLNKWDGYTFTVYEYIPFCENCISGNDISSIVEFSKNKFFIGTWGGGLNIFDATTNTFSAINGKTENKKQFAENYIQALILDKQKNLWIGTESQGLYEFIFPYDEFIHNKKSDENSIIDNRIWSLCEDKNGNIWIGTGNGLSQLDVVQNKFENYAYNPTVKGAINDTIIRSLFVDSKNNLWVGTGVGLSLFKPKEKQFQHFSIYENMPELNAVNDIIEDEKGNLWIGTFKSGLAYFETESGTFTIYQHDPNQANSINHNDVRQLLIDNANNLWIVTRGGGINIIDLKPEKFRHYKKSNVNTNTLSNNRITGIVELNENQVLLSTSGGGINVFDAENNSFSYILAGQGSKSISSNTINTIYLDRNKNLWIGYWDKGVEVFDPFKKQLKSNLSFNTQLSDLDVWTIRDDSYNNIWVGTVNGLNRIEKETGKVYNYVADNTNPRSISHNYIFYVFEDSDKILWIGTSKGLNRYNRESDDFTQYTYAYHPDSLINDRIHVIYEDAQKNLWIGTQLGLHQFLKEEERFISYRRGDKILNNTVFSILEDNDKNLWLGLLNGIARFNIETKQFKDYRFDRDNRFNDFSERAALKRSNGELIFGGVNGFNIFNPREIKENTNRPNTIITDIKILHQSFSAFYKEDTNVSFLKHLLLKHNQSTFSISFSALDFSNSQYNKYRYKLEGFDEDWIDNGYLNTANYTKIPPGNYLFKVFGSNNDGYFSNEPATLEITITPPFWITSWFLSIAIFFVLMLIYLFIKGREKILLRAKKELEIKVIQRTSEIEQQKEEIQAQSEELKKLSIVASETDNAVIILDTAGNIEWINEGFSKIYGFTLESLIKTKGSNILHASDNKDIIQIFEKCKNLKESVTYQTLSLTSENKKIWTQTTINPVLDEYNNVIKFVAIDSDISRLKEAEEAVLMQSKELELKNKELEKLSIVASETDNAVIIADHCGNIEWVNNAFTRILGYTLEEFKELRGATLLEVSQSPEIKDYLHSCIREKRPVVYVSRNKTRDGQIVWMQTTLTPVIVDDKIKKLVAIDTNITRLKLAEEEIEAQRDEIEAQRDHIAESQSEIQSSIIYAQRIQKAMMPPLKIIENNFSDYFLINMPRDIVSGDFYWCAQIENFIIFAVADCTGHGVPGALMSMLGLAYLNEIVSSYNVFQANAILNQLREKVKKSFHKNDAETLATDGMDIALCMYDINTKKLQFSGANNALYIVRGNELFEFLPDKMPIGVAVNDYDSFSNIEFQLLENDIVYLFSDGFADQFGGAKDKKFMLWRFKKMLTSMNNIALHEQKELLIEEHHKWRGKTLQVDDILIMGIKIS